MRKLCWVSFITVLFLAEVSFNTQATIIIDFEGLSDSDPITTQYSNLGVIFSGGSILTAGISLNEFDFPPYSGVNVVADDLGFVTVNFNSSVTIVEAYFTYVVPITLIAYDALNNVVGISNSLYSENYISSGNPPNELLGVSYNLGISRLEITGDPLGGSFVMDDFSFNPMPEPISEPIPEPTTLVLLGSGLVGMLTYKYKKHRGSN